MRSVDGARYSCPAADGKEAAKTDERSVFEGAGGSRRRRAGVGLELLLGGACVRS